MPRCDSLFDYLSFAIDFSSFGLNGDLFGPWRPGACAASLGTIVNAAADSCSLLSRRDRNAITGAASSFGTTALLWLPAP